MPFSYLKERRKSRRDTGQSDPSTAETDEEIFEEARGTMIRPWAEALDLTVEEFRTLVRGSVWEFEDGKLVAGPL